MNIIGSRLVDPVKLQTWRADVERAHGTLEEYARDTKSGLSAQEVEKLAGRPVDRSAIPDLLEQVGGTFDQDADLQARLKRLAASHALFVENEQQIVTEIVGGTLSSNIRSIAQEAMLAEKFVRAWQLLCSANRAEQIVGTKFLNDLKTVVMASARATRTQKDLATPLDVPQRKQLRTQCYSLYRSLFAADGSLDASIERDLRAVHVLTFDHADSAERAMYENGVKTIHKRIDDISNLNLKIDGLTMYPEVQQAISGARAQFYEAYGKHVFDMIADQLGYPRFNRAAMLQENSSETNRVLLVALEAQSSSSYTNFLREPSLTHWKAYADSMDRLIASSFLQKRITTLGSCAFMLDSSTKTFEFQMQRIREKQLLKSGISAGPVSSNDIDRLMEKFDLHDEPAAKSGKKTAGKKAQKKTARTVSAVTTPIREDFDIVPAHVRRSMNESLQHRRESRRLEGEAALAIAENYSIFASVIGMNEKIARRDRSELGEIDVHLDNAIVECTLMPGGEAKERQIEKLLTNRLINPFAKRVILYAPNYTENAENRLTRKHGSDLLVARNPEDLGLMLFVNWSDRARAQEQRARNS